MAWHQQGRCTAAAAAAAAAAARDGGGPGHEPDLEMAFVQATLQIRASEDLLRRVLRTPARAADTANTAAAAARRPAPR
jgi:hypothetical protein